MYILVFDIGCTNIKTIIMKITRNGADENIDLIGKEISKRVSFADFFYLIINKYRIDTSRIEKIVTTGTGVSFLDDSIDGVSILKVDEFTAVGYGGILLSKLDEALIVSIGTGTTIVYSNLYENIRLGGTGLGGGTFVGLSNAILNCNLKSYKIKTFDELISIAKAGKTLNVDLSIGDISKTHILNMSKDITAANFAGVNKEHNVNDLIAGVLNLILENISLLVNSFKKNLPIVYIGTLVTNDIVKKRLVEISEYTGDKIHFVDNADYAICIGAWEYYLLKVRSVKL